MTDRDELLELAGRIADDLSQATKAATLTQALTSVFAATRHLDRLVSKIEPREIAA